MSFGTLSSASAMTEKPTNGWGHRLGPPLWPLFLFFPAPPHLTPPAARSEERRGGRQCDDDSRAAPHHAPPGDSRFLEAG